MTFTTKRVENFKMTTPKSIRIIQPEHMQILKYPGKPSQK